MEWNFWPLFLIGLFVGIGITMVLCAPQQNTPGGCSTLNYEVFLDNRFENKENITVQIPITSIGEVEGKYQECVNKFIEKHPSYSWSNYDQAFHCRLLSVTGSINSDTCTADCMCFYN